jgi:hypothetical protein
MIIDDDNGDDDGFSFKTVYIQTKFGLIGDKKR